MGWKASGSEPDNITIGNTVSGKLEVKEDYRPDVQTQSEHELAIIELQANATLTPIDHDTLISDTFSDTTGYNNTVNTGNTTSSHDSTNKKYRCLPYTTDKSFETNTTHCDVGMAATSQKKEWSHSFTPTSDLSIRRVQLYLKTKTGSPTGNITVRLETNNAGKPSGTLVDANATAIVLGTTLSAIATWYNWVFSSDISLTASTVYHIVVLTNEPAGTSKTYNFSAGTGSGSGYYRIAEGIWQSDTENLNYKLDSFDGYSTVECDLPTITGTITATQLVANCPDRETGDNVTYELADTTPNTDTNLALNTKNTLINVDGALLSGGKLRIKQTSKTSLPTEWYPSVKTYTLKLWKQ